MPDVEKVISALEEQITWIRDNDFHKFPGWGHAVLAMKDALSLLKAQEPRVMAGAELTDAELIEKIRKAPITLKPAVDAAPVEWLEEQAKDNYDYSGTLIRGLLSEWQKEQEGV